MIRVLATEPLGPGPNLLPDDEGHHLDVRRAATGEAVEVLDGQGGVGRGILARQGRRWQVEVDHVDRVARPPELALLVGAGDKDRFFWMTEKAVEVAVTRIIPVETERSRAVSTRLRADHRERLERRALEALKQCGGAWRTVIDPPRPLPDAIAAAAAGTRWLAAEDGGAPGRLGGAEPVTIAVGPEGGFTEAERSLLGGLGFRPVRLGRRTMRFETAAVVAAAVADLSRKEQP